jgi:CARDB
MISLLMLQSALAYDLAGYQWPPGVRYLPILAPPDMEVDYPERWEALQDAARRISDTAANCGIEVQADDDYDHALDNGETEVFFTTSTDILCDDEGCAIAFMSPEASGGYRYEADVVVDGGFDWRFTRNIEDNPAYLGGSSASYRPLLNTAVHELLHVMGLDHESDVYNVMGNAWNVVTTSGGSTRTYVGEDATQGLIALYGPREEYEDLSLSHWQLDDDSGEYSTHRRVTMKTDTGADLPTATISAAGDDDIRYQVSEGQRLSVDLTLENNGLSSHTVSLYFYLSTDDRIRPSDTFVASRRVTLVPNVPLTRNFTITLPAGVTGERWLGAKIDATRLVDESNDNNNAVYVAALDIL